MQWLFNLCSIRVDFVDMIAMNINRIEFALLKKNLKSSYYYVL